MKGIIMTVAIAAGMALGGAASGQTQEKVNEIIRKLKQSGVFDENRCLKNASKKMQRAYDLISQEITGKEEGDLQIMESFCRYMNDMK